MSSVFSKKGMPAFVLSLAVCASGLSADEMKEKMKQSDMPKAPSGMINPPVNPDVKDGSNLFFSIDALLLKAVEGGMDYMLTTSANVTNGAQSGDAFAGFNGPTKCASYKWDWGFRADLGYNLPHDGWDIQAVWMHFNTKNKQTHVETPYATQGKVIVATGETASGVGFQAGFTNAVYANVHYNLNLRSNFIDLRLGREFFVSKYMTLAPHFGGRDAILNRTFHLKYGGASSLAEVTNGVYYQSLHILNSRYFLIQDFQNKFHGGGAFVGVDAGFGFGGGWSLYTTFDLALLYGKSQSKMAEYQADANNPANTQTRFRTNVAEYDTRPMTDILAGIRWEQLFSDNAFRLRFQLGWEQHTVYGFNQKITALSILPSADGSSTALPLQYRNKNLTINGVSFQTRFDF